MPQPEPVQHLAQRLPRRILLLLRRLGRTADEEGIRLFLVGGVVRDLLLKRSNWDLDFTVEGDGIAFARLVADRCHAGLALFERFSTARLVLPNGLKVDIASTRRESYAKPAALPHVRPASLEEDLFRRDFTINAMAIQVNAGCWGQFRDPYGGQQDLKNKILRVLHDRSFVDDPTRIFRAIRFTERFGFRLESHTARLLEQAAKTNMVANLSGPRLASEIFALMKEDRPDAAIASLRRFRLLRFLHPQLLRRTGTQRVVAVLPKTIGWWRRHYHEASLDRPLLWLMALFVDATPSMISGTIQRLQLSTGHARALEWAGVKTSRIAGRLASDALLRPSQVYRLLSRLPNEALAMVLAKGLATARGVAAGRLTGRIQRFLTRDRRATTTINGETLKRLGLEPGPHFKKVLERLLNERLDGRITAATQERDRARRLVERYR